MPCILATKRQQQKRQVTYCNRIVGANSNHFCSITEAKKSGQPICASCLRVWKRNHPPKETSRRGNGKRKLAKRRKQSPLEVVLVSSPTAQDGNIVASQYPTPLSFDLLDVETIKTLREIALSIATLDTDEGCNHEHG